MSIGVAMQAGIVLLARTSGLQRLQTRRADVRAQLGRRRVQPAARGRVPRLSLQQLLLRPPRAHALPRHRPDALPPPAVAPVHRLRSLPVSHVNSETSAKTTFSDL